MIQAFLADGTPVLLSQELGRGGEAVVLQVDGLSNLVAKIYHQPSLERHMKLEAMIARPPSDPTAEQNHISICWPTALIFDQSRKCLGFLMPRVDYSMSVPVFMLYNPKDRWKVRAGFTWRYLLRTAVNISSAIEAVHAKGYVVGDLNESNIMVAETALVTLVDCDSMQVPQAGKAMFYRCPVGKPEYTPPELQSVDFSTTDRNAAHDNFGLAVMIFQLLMEGIHPFAGVTKGVDMSVQERIRRGESPYAGSQVIRPMPIAPPFGILPRDIQSLFLRCFQEGHSKPSARPDAREWRVALTAAEQELVVCARNEQHVYSKHYALYECPWCERTMLFGGFDPFPEPGKQMALPAPAARNLQVDSAIIKQRQQSRPATVDRKSNKQRRTILTATLLVLTCTNTFLY
jgi:DNA-binding helix-hairpin-helix protein with protein kinase domain